MREARCSAEFLLRDIRVVVEANELHKPAGVIKLEPKIMATLAFLARHPGKIVTKEEIRREVWGSTIVVDAALLRIISLLRKALDDTPRAPRYIETISKRGYRLIVEPVPVMKREPARDGPSTTPKMPAFFNFRFIQHAAPAILAFVALTAALGAGSLVVATRSNSDTLENETIARAQLHYQQFRDEDNENAIALFESVIDRATTSGVAHSGLASALAQRYFMWSDDPVDLQMAIVTAREAVRLAPNAAHSHKALGLSLEYAGDSAGALESYLSALEHEPDHWPSIANIGDIYFARGEYRLALNWFTRAHAISPDQTLTAAKLGKAEMALEHYPEATKWFTFILEQRPLHQNATAALARAEFYRGSAGSGMRRCEFLLSRLPHDPSCGVAKTDMLMAQGDWAGAEKALEKYTASAPPKWADYILLRRSQLAYYQNDSQTDALYAFIARAKVNRDMHHMDKRHWALAAAHALLDNRNESLLHLNAARAFGWSDSRWDELEPAFQSLRDDNRFREYLTGRNNRRDAS